MNINYISCRRMPILDLTKKCKLQPNSTYTLYLYKNLIDYIYKNKKNVVERAVYSFRNGKNWDELIEEIRSELVCLHLSELTVGWCIDAVEIDHAKKTIKLNLVV